MKIATHHETPCGEKEGFVVSAAWAFGWCSLMWLVALVLVMPDYSIFNTPIDDGTPDSGKWLLAG
jgi:hypothetical protein